MKNSNIVLTSFLALFVLYLFGILVEIRVRGEKWSPSTVAKIENCNSDFRNVTKLQEIKILKISKISQAGTIILDQSSDAAFTTFKKSKNGESWLTYHTVGDTLIIDKLSSENPCNTFKLELGGKIPEIIIDSVNVNLRVKSDNLEKLKIKSAEAFIEVFRDENKMTNIDSLEIDLDSNSSFSFLSGSINSGSINFISGKVSNSSTLYLTEVKSKNTSVSIGGNSTVVDRYSYHNPDPDIKLVYEKQNTEEEEAAIQNDTLK